jgi:hypothetical protein
MIAGVLSQPAGIGSETDAAVEAFESAEFFLFVKPYPIWAKKGEFRRVHSDGSSGIEKKCEM